MIIIHYRLVWLAIIIIIVIMIDVASCNRYQTPKISFNFDHPMQSLHSVLSREVQETQCGHSEA